MNDEFSGISNRIIMKNRKELSISGAKDVDSFDEGMIIAVTDRGELTVKGEGLRILSLNTETGEMSVEGNDISSLVFTGDKKDTSGFFKKLFK